MPVIKYFLDKTEFDTNAQPDYQCNQDEAIPPNVGDVEMIRKAGAEKRYPYEVLEVERELHQSGTLWWSSNKVTQSFKVLIEDLSVTK